MIRACKSHTVFVTYFKTIEYDVFMAIVGGSNYLNLRGTEPFPSKIYIVSKQ